MLKPKEKDERISFTEANAPLVDFMKRCGSRFADVLAGKEDPREVMFPGGSLDSVESIYRDTPQSRYYNGIMAAAVKGLADTLPMDKRLSILEIGAGTGGTSSALLPELPPARTRYVYTDISPLFTARARTKFAGYSFVEYKTLDISSDPAGQGFRDGEFDVIVCANIMHATRDLVQAMANLTRLLASGGILLLREITLPRPAMGFEISFGCLLDSLEDTGLRGINPFLTVKKWEDLLLSHGFDRFACYPDPQDTAFDEHILIARRQGGTKEAFQDSAGQEKTDNGIAMAGEDTGHVLLGRRLSSPLPAAQFVSRVSGTLQPFLAQHQVFNIVVVPGTAHFDLAASAARNFFGCEKITLENVVLREALMLDDGERNLQVLVSPAETGADFEIYSQSVQPGQNDWHLHVSGQASPASAMTARRTDLKKLCAGGQVVDVPAFYEKFASYGAVQYGPAFRGLRQLWRIEGGAVAEVALDPDEAAKGQGFLIHPALLDSCLQSMVAAMASSGEDKLGSDGFMPFSVERIIFHGQAGDRVWCKAVMKEGDTFDQDMFQASFSIYTPEGDLICEIIHLNMRRTNKKTLEALKAGQKQHNDLCYDIVWRQAILPRDADMSGHWLILAASDAEFTQALACEVEKRGGTTAVLPCTETSSESGSVSCASPDDFGRAIDLWKKAGNPRGIFFLWGLDCGMPDFGTNAEESFFKTHTAMAMLHLAQALGKEGAIEDARLVILTCQAQKVRATDQPMPAQSLLWGLEKSLASEMGSISPLIVDLDPVLSLKEQLPAICSMAADREYPEDKIAMRANAAHAPRLVRAQSTAKTMRQAPVAKPDSDAWVLEFGGNGIENINIRPFTRRLPGPGEVEIAVEAYGMNFRNVMVAMGVSDQVTMLVLDCAGSVVSVGEGVTRFAPGDRVFTTAYGSFSSHVYAREAFTARMPQDMSFVDAAEIPTVFMTSWHALMDVAKLEPGERVLLHSATGGVGLAAIQVARARGAEVLATAGTHAKRAMLRSMGIEHVFSSRSADFETGVMEATKGQGVHVVLNFLVGDLAEAGMRCLCHGGRFVEIGKTDVRTPEQAASVRQDISYQAVDMERLGQEDEAAMTRIFAEVMAGFEKGQLAPIPRRVFTMDAVRTAFRYMLEGRHTGKLVLSAKFAPHSEGVRREASYLVTGGLSELGLALAGHLARQGAEHIWLLGRHLPEQGSAQAKSVAAIEGQGCHVSLARVDVTDRECLRAFFDTEIVPSAEPLAGVFHLAGHLDDDTMDKLDWKRFDSVLAPKVDGSWYLHELTRDMPLDHFVVFSSIASVFGTHGQSNHVAANTFMDALIDARRADFLPGLAVNWGAWGEIGTVVRLGILDRIRQQGVEGFDTATGLAILDSLMAADAAHKVVTRMDWSRMMPLLRSTKAAAMYDELAQAGKSSGSSKAATAARETEAGLAEELRSLPMKQRDERLRIYLKKEIAGFLRISADTIPEDANLTSLGMDSLISLDLFQRISKDLKIRIAPHEVSAKPTVAAMADKFAHDLGPDVEEAHEAAGQNAGLAELYEPDPEHACDPFPLSDMQQAYWLGRNSGTAPLGGGSCHFYFEAEASGISLERYEKAWNILIRRHDMLRTVIEDGEQQRVLNDVPEYHIECHDLQSLSGTEQEERLDGIRSRLSHEVLAVDRWPTFRVEASRLSEDTLRLHFSFDLIISDFHGISLMMRELEKAYAGGEQDLPGLELTFRDYRLAEERFRSTKAYQEDKEYWLRRLDKLPPAPRLPLAVAPDTVTRPRFSRRSRILPARTWQLLKERAASRGFTATGVTLAAFAEVLGLWSDASSFTLNMTLFNRLPVHEAVNSIVGEFTSNTLLEISLAEGDTFEGRAGQIWAQLWQDLEHRSYSGVRLMRQMARRKGANAGMMPVVFTSTLAMDASFSSFSMGLGHEVYSVSQTPQVWLDHQLFEINQELRLIWDCVDDLFPEGLIDAMFDTYAAFLERLASSDEAWIMQSPVSAPDSQLVVREAVNATARDVPACLMYEPFLEQARKRPEAKALICGHVTMTYGELERRSREVASIVRKMEDDRSRPVAIAMDKGWPQVVAALGIQRAGLAYLPLDMEQPPKRLAQILSDARVRLILGVQTLQDRIPADNTAAFVAVDALSGAASSGTPFSEQEQDANSLAYVIYTSGSTGTPKGVMISHDAAMNTILDVSSRFGVSDKDVVLGVSRLSFDLSVYDIFGTLAAGACLVLPEENEVLNPPAWTELMARHGVTIWNTVPALGQLLCEAMEEKGIRDNTLRLAVFSGDWIPVSLPGRLSKCAPGVRVIAMGGATEASIWSNFHEVTAEDAARPSIPYGTPLSNQGFAVLDSHMENRPDWVSGRLYIAGRGLAKGYLNDPKKTAERFVSHEGQRLYDTGDMARYLPDGTLEFLGREDTQVKVHGLRVELGEIEAAIKEHDGVGNAAVVAITGHNGEQTLCAFLDADKKQAASLMIAEEAPERLSHVVSGISDILKDAEKATDLDPSLFKAMWHDLEDLYLAAARRALSELGLFGTCSSDPDAFMHAAGIARRYKKWIGRALHALEDRGLIGRDEAGLWQMTGTGPELTDCLKRAQEALDTMNFDLRIGAMLEQTVLSLAAILREERHSGELYSDESVPGLYQKVLAMCNQLASRVAMRAAGREGADGADRDQPCRILEVGAGYGTLTQHLLPLLDGTNTTYDFTDISRFFLSLAQKAYARYGFVNYGLLNLDKDPLLQGRQAHSYDLIIAGNVLHDVTDIRETLAGLKGLLKPSGILLIMEQTSFQLPLDLAEGLQQGYESASDADLRQDHPILSREEWRMLFLEQGLAEPVFLMPDDSVEAFLGLEVFVSAGPSAVSRFNAGAMDGFLRERLPAYMVPASFQLLRMLPLTNNGKIDRRQLLEAAGENALAPEEMVAPRNSTEERIAGIWKDVLGLDKAGVTTSFFMCGGDSLSAFQLLKGLNKAFGGNFTLGDLMQAQSIAQQAELVSAARGSKHAPLVVLHEAESPLGLCFAHPIEGLVTAYAGLSAALPGLSFYALQSRGLEGEAGPENDFLNMVSDYLEAVKTSLSPSRLVLGGWSMGAFLAWEMAHRLPDNDLPLILLDPPSKKIWDAQYGQRSANVLSLMEQVIPDAQNIVADMGLSAASFEVLSQDEQVRIFASGLEQAGLLGRTLPEDMESVRRLLMTGLANVRALHQYQPGPMQNRAVLYIRSSSQSDAGVAYWRQLAGSSFKVVEVSGDHWHMFSSKEDIGRIAQAIEELAGDECMKRGLKGESIC